MKTLEKGSKYETADTNGDNIVSDKELEIKERMILLENRDKKEDQQRWLVWFSAMTVTIFIVVLMTPLIPIDPSPDGPPLIPIPHSPDRPPIKPIQQTTNEPHVIPVQH